MATVICRTNPSGKVVYRVEYRLKGQKSLSKTFPTKKMAQEFVKVMDTRIIQDKQNALLGIKDHLFASVIDRYIAEVQYRKSKSTKINEQYILLFWQKKLGHIQVNTIKPQDIALIFAELYLNHKQSTVHHKAVILHSVFEFAVEQSIINTSPMDRMKLPSVGQPRVRYLNAEEIENLLWACEHDRNKWIYSLVLMALHTGARRGELLRLKYGDVAERYITFRIRKNGKAHQVPMTPQVREVLQVLENDATGNIPSMRPYMSQDLIFQPNRGEKLDIRKAWNRVREQANLEDIHFHDLRHTTASILLQNGYSLAMVSKVLGHVDIKSSARYAHLEMSHVEDALNRVFGGK